MPRWSRTSSRRLVISGQVGYLGPGRLVPSSGEAQLAQVFRNLRTILRAHNMDFSNVVKTLALPHRSFSDVRLSRRAGQRVFAEHAPASTLLFVSGLADPRWLVEIAARGRGIERDRWRRNVGSVNHALQRQERDRWRRNVGSVNHALQRQERDRWRRNVGSVDQPASATSRA